MTYFHVIAFLVPEPRNSVLGTYGTLNTKNLIGYLANYEISIKCHCFAVNLWKIMSLQEISMHSNYLELVAQGILVLVAYTVTVRNILSWSFFSLKDTRFSVDRNYAPINAIEAQWCKTAAEKLCDRYQLDQEKFW